MAGDAGVAKPPGEHSGDQAGHQTGGDQGMARSGTSERQPDRGGEWHEQQPTRPDQRGGGGSQSRGQRQEQPPPLAARLPGSRPEEQLQRQQRAEHRLGEDEDAKRDQSRVECGGQPGQPRRPAAEKAPCQEPGSGDGNRAEDRGQAAGRNHRWIAAENQKQRGEQGGIAGRAKNSRTISAILEGLAGGDRTGQRPIAFAVAEDEPIAGDLCLPENGRRDSNAQRNGQQEREPSQIARFGRGIIGRDR